jgi:hypothetical protein
MAQEEEREFSHEELEYMMDEAMAPRQEAIEQIEKIANDWGFIAHLVDADDDFTAGRVEDWMSKNAPGVVRVGTRRPPDYDPR